MLEKCPQIYFVGNQTEFKSKSIAGVVKVSSIYFLSTHCLQIIVFGWVDQTENACVYHPNCPFLSFCDGAVSHVLNNIKVIILLRWYWQLCWWIEHHANHGKVFFKTYTIFLQYHIVSDSSKVKSRMMTVVFYLYSLNFIIRWMWTKGTANNRARFLLYQDMCDGEPSNIGVPPYILLINTVGKQWKRWKCSRVNGDIDHCWMFHILVWTILVRGKVFFTGATTRAQNIIIIQSPRWQTFLDVCKQKRQLAL